MNNQPMSYLNPKLDSGEIPSKGHCGVFAVEPVTAGELLVVWAGRIVGPDELNCLNERQQMHSVQVEDNLYQAPFGDGEPADCINHSCEPNAGFRGQITLVAIRDIETGEEVCIDYAMCDSTPYDEFECGCGAGSCRGYIRGIDWQNPELWEKYDGYFSTYLQVRINQLRREHVKSLPMKS